MCTLHASTVSVAWYSLSDDLCEACCNVAHQFSLGLHPVCVQPVDYLFSARTQCSWDIFTHSDAIILHVTPITPTTAGQGAVLVS